MIEQKSKKGAWIALIAVLLWLGLVFALDQLIKPTDKLGMLLIVLQKGSVYALAAVSMNLLNGYTGLFSLGHAGFMLLGAYTYAIFTIPDKNRDSVYQYFDAAIRFSIPEQLSKHMGGFGTALGYTIAIILLACIRSRLDEQAVPAPLRGAPIVLISAALMSIAFMGFAGLTF
jgi:branched-chain amino acid transport system permease protein